MLGQGRHSFRAANSPLYHYVKPGENLYRISQQYNSSVKKLSRLNRIHDPSQIDVGQRLLVGYSKGGPATKYARASLSSSPEVSSIPTSSGKLLWPTQGGRLVSSFGPRSRGFHDGIDIAAKSGTPVYAAHSGLVIYADDGLSGYGNLVIIRDKTGFTTIYAHNRRLLVRVGQRVSRGKKIAEVGSTGRSSGPHLHFEVRLKDRRDRIVAVDPLPLLGRGTKSKPRYRQNERLTGILAKVFD